MAYYLVPGCERVCCPQVSNHMIVSVLFSQLPGVPPTGGAYAIQLALAPVFLLTGIAGMLSVMTARLSRVIDRARYLTEPPPPGVRLTPAKITLELHDLERRRQFANVAITSCTLAALLVCIVIVVLFLEVLLEWPLRWLEGILFATAAGAMVVGLSYFLREVRLANHTVRIEIAMSDPLAPPGSPGPG